MRRFATGAAIAVTLLGAGCGGGDDGDGEARRATPPDVATIETPPPAQQPQSAGDTRGPAPDDAISDRPGGPPKNKR